MNICSLVRQTVNKEVPSITRLSVFCAGTAVAGETKSLHYIYSHKTLIAH